MLGPVGTSGLTSDDKRILNVRYQSNMQEHHESPVDLQNPTSPEPLPRHRTEQRRRFCKGISACNTSRPEKLTASPLPVAR